MVRIELVNFGMESYDISAPDTQNQCSSPELHPVFYIIAKYLNKSSVCYYAKDSKGKSLTL